MVNEKIIETIRQFVEDECKKPTSKYGYEPYKFHLVQVHNYSKELALRLNANVEIVRLSAWLHDVGSIIHGRKDHHITSANIAEIKLLELNYSLDKISQIQYCILNHRGSIESERKTIESKVIADADAISNFDNIAGIFKAAFVYENKSQGEALVCVRKKLQEHWDKLSLEESRILIKPKYEAAMLLLGG